MNYSEAMDARREALSYKDVPFSITYDFFHDRDSATLYDYVIRRRNTTTDTFPVFDVLDSESGTIENTYDWDSIIDVLMGKIEPCGDNVLIRDPERFISITLR